MTLISQITWIVSPAIKYGIVTEFSPFWYIFIEESVMVLMLWVLTFHVLSSLRLKFVFIIINFLGIVILCCGLLYFSVSHALILLIYVLVYGSGIVIVFLSSNNVLEGWERLEKDPSGVFISSLILFLIMLAFACINEPLMISELVKLAHIGTRADRAVVQDLYFISRVFYVIYLFLFFNSGILVLISMIAAISAAKSWKNLFIAPKKKTKTPKKKKKKKKFEKKRKQKIKKIFLKNKKKKKKNQKKKKNETILKDNDKWNDDNWF